MSQVKQNAYHPLSRIVHWGMALVLIGLLVVGFYMTLLPYGDDKFLLYGLHKSFGLLILLLVCVRLGKWLFIPKPGHLETHQWWERALAKIIHVLLYVFMVLMPVSGWVMSSAGDFPISFFGLPVPDIVGKDQSLFEFSRTVHALSSFGLIGCVGLHALGALKHHFIDGDVTLSRMVGFYRSVLPLACVLIVFVALYVSSLILGGQYAVKTWFIAKVDGATTHSEAGADTVVKDDMASDLQKWSIIFDQSHIEFTATQYGQDFSGSFPNFDGDIYFDPDHLEQSKVHIVIDISTLKTGSADRDVQALSSDWFDVATYPKAIYSAEIFEKVDDVSYIAKGTLELRGVSLAVDLPFDLEITSENDGTQRADMDARFVLNRLDFGIGQGSWSSTDAIGGDVLVDVHVSAIRR